jgi:hypothetical protein
MHSKGNWIEYKKEYEDMIQKKVDSIRSKNMVDEKEKTVGDQRPAPPSDSK